MFKCTQLIASAVRRGIAVFIALALAIGPVTGPASAANRYWDPNGTASGRGGTGTWNTTSLFWSPNGDGVSGPYTVWSNTNLDDAIFGGTVTGTVTLGTSITLHNLTFEDLSSPNTAYTITGNTLMLAGATPTITVNGGINDNAIINSIIAGTAGLTKAGGGVLTLNGVNTFSGGVTVNGGGLAVNGDAALGASSNGITMAGGTTLINAGTTDLSAGRVVTITGNVTLTTTGTGEVGSARFTGSGGLTINTNIALNNNANDYTGQTIFRGQGNHLFTSIGNVGGGPSALGAPTTAANGTIVLNAGSGAESYAIYTGTGPASSDRNWVLNPAGFSEAAIKNSGGGTLTLSGSISSGGGTSPGLIFWADTSDLVLSGVISSSGDKPVSLTGSAVARSITLTGANTFNGPVSIGVGAFGGGGAVTVRASSLANMGTASSLGTGTAGTVTINSGSALSYIGSGGSSDRTWTINGNGTIRNDGTGALALSGPVTFQSAGVAENLTLGGTYSGVNTFSGLISGTGNVIMDGAAGDTWLLTNANTYVGTTTVNGGTLQVGNTQAFGLVPQAVAVNGGTLDLNGFDVTFTQLSGTGGSVALTGVDLSINGTTTTSYAGSIAGDGGLVKRGTGTLTLTGSNTYTGATTVGGGTLALNFSAAAAPASNIISNGSALTMAGGTLIITGAAGVANTQTFNGLTVAAGNNKVAATSGGSGGSLTLNLGAISQLGGLIDFALPSVGSGAITTTNPIGNLGGWATVTSGTNTDYAKVVDIGGGIRVIAAFTAADYQNRDDASTWLNGEVISDAGGGANTPFFGTVNGSKQIGGLQYTAAAASTVTVGSGQTLGIDGTIIVGSSVGNTGKLIQGGNLTGPVNGGTLGVLQNGTGNFTIASTIIDNGGAVGFAKGGAGQVTLSNNNNSYTGETTLSGGTLAVSSIGNGNVNSAIGASSADSSNLVLENGTLRYTGVTATTNRGFTLINGGPARAIQVDSGTNLTFSGLVTSPDDAGFTKTGSGILTLSNGSNNYVGVTNINGGTLSVGTLANGGVVSGIGASSGNPANLVLTGGGFLQYTGGTANIDRGFTVTAGGGGGGFDVSEAATALTLSGTGVGNGTLNKRGPGTLVLAGMNTYTGGTSVQQGTLRAGSTQAFGPVTGGGNMAVASGATLDLAGFDNTIGGLNGTGTVVLGTATLTIANKGIFDGAIDGDGGIVITNEQTLSGCRSNYRGSTNISGILSVDCLTDGGQPSGIGASSSDPENLVLTRNGRLIYTGSDVTTDRGFQVLSGGGTFSRIEVANPATSLAFTGVFAGDGALWKDGPGTLTLSGDNTFEGQIEVREGTLQAGSSSAFGAASVSLHNVAGVVLDVNNLDPSVAYLVGGGSNGGNVTLGTGTLTITTGSTQNDGTGVDYAGAISGEGGVIKSGAAAQRFSSCSSTYNGSTTVNAGTLEVGCLTNGGTASSIGQSDSDAGNLILNGGTLKYVGDGDTTDRLFTLGPSATGKLDASGTGPVSFTNAGAIAFSSPNTAQTIRIGGTSTADNSLAAQITDNGTGQTSLTKEDTGTWILRNQASTYTGVTTISGGVLGVDKLANGGEASSLGASASDASNLVIGNGSTLRYTGIGDTTDRLFTLAQGTTFIESSGTGAVVFSNTAPITLQGTGTRTIALGGSNTDLNTMGGAIADADATTGRTTLAKNGPGTWMLTGNNTYTGNTVINDGNLVIGNGGTSGNAGAGNVIVNAPTSTLSFNRGDTFDFNGTLSGPGTIAQIGTGTTVLTATGNAIGAARIDAGTLQIGNGTNPGDLTTATLAMNGSGTLIVASNGTVGAAGGTQTAITGDGGASAITVDASGTLRANGDLGGGSDVVTLLGMLDTGATALSLGDGDDRLTLNDGAALSGSVDGGAGTDLLQVNNAAPLTLDTARVTGFESLDKELAGTLTLTGDHSYTAGTTIGDGVLQIGDGGTSGTLAGPITNNATLAFNRSDALTVAGPISGTGGVNQIGAGVTTLTGANSYAGPTDVQAGTLLINGDQSGATGPTSVASGAALGGTGVLGGNLTVADGGALNPGGVGNVPGTLTVNGDVGLSGGSILNYNFGEANVVGGPFNDLLIVRGDLTLGGTLNVTQSPGGVFGPGVYRVVSYDGTLTNNGLALGTMPAGSNVSVQTAVANQINLINTTGQTLNFWDGDAGPKNNGVVNGGDGTWQNSTGNDNWTDSAGTLNAPYTDATFAIFQGTGGVVTVDNSLGNVSAAGMQFAADGYTIQGDQITLVGPQSTIRVGDGTDPGAGYTVTIAAELTGTTELVKSDLGTLVLTGTNTYTGGTAIDGGTLRISSDANLGDAAGGLRFDNGTLNTTADITSGRIVTLDGAGTFLADAGTTATFTGDMTGAGALTKDGAGTLVVAGDASHSGGTTITAGTLQVGDGATSGSLVGNVINNGTLALNRSDEVTFAGLVSGTGDLQQIGTGTTILTGDSTYTGGTTIASGTLQLGNGGTSGSITGDVANDGTLVVNRSDALTLDGVISGSGDLQQSGTGTTILTGDSTYTGGTTIASGTLQLGDGGTSGSITGDVTNNGTLVFNRSDAVTFAGVISGSGDLRHIGDGITTLTATNTYSGGTAIDGGTLRISTDANLGDAAGGLSFNGGTLNTTADVASGRDVALAGAGIFLTDAGTSTTLTGGISGAGALTKDGAGTLVVAGDASHSGGTTITAGTLQVGDGATSGTLAGDVTNNGTLAFNRSDDVTFAGVVSGTGDLQQIGTGTTILTSDSSYTGGTTIASGTLQLGDGGTSGSITGDVTNNGTLAFDRSDAVTFDGLITGTGGVNQIGAGMTTLTADNAYAGPTDIQAGTLLVNGDQSGATGLTSVESGATLGGMGTLGGDVTVSDGGAISPGSSGDAPGTLTVNGNVALSGASVLNYNFGQANVPGGAFNDLLTVHGDLTLDGILNVTTTVGGSFDPGIYRVISYDGTLTNNGLAVGTIPSSDYYVQTAVANQVNLVNATGLTLNFWDGAAGPKNDGDINGGDGTWQNSTGNDNWTESTGQLNAPYSDGAFAIFESTAGTVTVDNSLGNVSASGMQFASDGYSIVGDRITLVGPQSNIRVGDGTEAGANYTATIAVELTGNTQLLKSDLGTLVLSGINTYTGGTAINGGTLQIASDANLGDTVGGLLFDGGTLNTTADITSGRDVTLDGAGAFLTDAGTTTTLTGGISGAGALTKDGAGTLVVAGDASHSGGTTITAGTLQVGDGGTSGTLAGDVTNNATLAFNRSDSSTFGGVVSGTGDLQQIGTGTTILTGESSYTGGTTIAAGTLQLGDGGTSGSITGNVANNGTLAFKRSDAITFPGLIVGTGGIDQTGTGTTTLTADNAYAGPTNVQAGTLLVNGDQSAAPGLTTVATGGTLGGTGIIGGDVTVADGAINPGAPDAVGTLTANGDLTLGPGSFLNFEFGQANVEGGALNDLLKVGGDLTLDGTLNVTTTPGGSFGPGIYRVISYGGSLIADNTLGLGTVPDGSHTSIQTSVAHQVNLVNGAGQTLNFWDGDAGPKADGVVNGGGGIWRAAGDDNWTDPTGGTNAAFTNGSFAIFAGAPGTVNVDNGLGAVTASGMQFATNGYTVQGEPITLVGTQATIRVGDGTAEGAGYRATIAAELTGSAGLVKTDLGTLALTGTNSYTGATDVVGGTLAVDGSIASSALMVHNGARLTGIGTVGPTTVATGGTIAPGHSIGTLNFVGPYTQASGTAYEAEVDPTSTASDQVAVTGGATLESGAVINVTKTTNAPYKLGTRYTVLTTTEGLRGSFDVTGDTTLTAFAGLTDLYDANNAYLVVAQTRSFTEAARTPNQTAVGTGLDGLPPTSALLTVLINMPDDAAARQAFDQLSGEIHASARTAFAEESHFVRDAATDRIREAFCAVGANVTTHRNIGAPLRLGDSQRPSDECEQDDRLTLWGQAFGSWGHTDGDGNAASLSRSTGGFFLGADAPIRDNWRIGVLGGYSRSSFGITSRNSSAGSDDYNLGLYAGTQWAAVSLRAGITYTWHDMTTSRSVTFPGFGDTLMANYNAGTTQVFGDVGYRIDAGRFAFEPFANLAYVNLHTDGFTENGGTAALKGRSDDTMTTFTTLGLRAATDLAFGNVGFKARGSLGWRHAFGDTPVATLSFLGGSAFGIAGVPIANNAAVLDAGLDFGISEEALLGLSYGGQFSTSAVDQSVRGNFSLKF
ncbi:autotransporter-associated beta strand repeat-containing protein [Chelatococcus sp. GCM10030263]|uniref:autotransporter-associated beta strand repeat-containing protein n=1 Tax=Chelatococcus sp. GCM10030263 TaxID=3273387 RepID=UPI00361EEDEC